MQGSTDIVGICQELERNGADVVGMNCFRGPETMLPWITTIRESVSCHVGALPIPCGTTSVKGRS